MDITNLVRNASRVKETLFREGDSVVTTTGCSIIIPDNYTSKGLATVGTEVTSLGIFALVIEDKYYSVSKATSMMTFGPCETDVIMIDGRGYLKLTFEPGGVVITNVQLIISKTLTNYIMDYFVDYGQTPWFFNQADQAGLFKYAGYFNNMDLGTPAVQDIIMAGISRDPNNVKVYFRHTDNGSELLKMTPRYVPLRDIAINTTSNLARINGSELKRGIKETLLSEPTRVEDLEALYLK